MARAGHVISARARMHRGVVGHKTRLILPEDAAIQHDVPVSSPARTLMDIASLLEPRALERALVQAETLRIVTREQLEARFTSDRAGAGTLREILARDAPAPTRSELEQRFLAFLDAHGLPEPLVNQRVEGIEVDIHWPGARLVVELDGFAFHATRDAFERDRARDAALQAAGWIVIRLTHRRLTEQPEAVAAELASLLRAGGTRRVRQGHTSRPTSSPTRAA